MDDDLTFYTDRRTRMFLSQWSKMAAPTWTGEPMFPTTLTKEELATATTEYLSLPEFFYTTFSWLPVVTPDTLQLFLDLLQCGQSGHTEYHVMLWCFCSGSSRLLTTMFSLPFLKLGLFPVDLRYGWDLRDPIHQRKLLQVDRMFRPQYTTFEPRCKYWSRAGTKRKAEDTMRLREAEYPMLKFCAKRAIALPYDKRDALFENPRASALWTESPLCVLQSLDQYSKNDKNTFMCAFSPEPDGRRSQKATKLKASFPLNKSIRRCQCKLSHLELQGYDPATHRARTAAHALFHKKFCLALCQDMCDDYNTKGPTRKPQRQYPVDDDDSDEPAVPAAQVPPQTHEEGLRRMDTKCITLRNGSAGELLTEVDPQMLKASIQDLLDYAAKFGLPHQPSGRVYLTPSDDVPNVPSHKTAFFFQKLIANFFTMTALSAQVHRKEIYMFTIPQHLLGTVKDRLIIRGTEVGNFTLDLDQGWQDLSLDKCVTLRDEHIYCVIALGNLTPEGARTTIPRRRITGKSAPPLAMSTPSAATPAAAAAPQVKTEKEGEIKLNGRTMKAIQPSLDLVDLPRKLRACDDVAERARLLLGLHERFWHCSAYDMMRFLQAALLPKEIVLQGIEIANSCKVCAPFKAKLHRPSVKSHLATTFNEIVQHDLFFLWDLTFMLLIDEALKWKTGDHIPNKLGPTIVRALYRLWLRFWGPMQNILSDQEGGLLSTEADRLFDKLHINRLLVGQGATTTKGLVERHIALTKFGMMKLKKACDDEGLQLEPSDICLEICMSQNCILEYDGGTPQLALTGQPQRGWYTPDSTTLEAAQGALTKKPDYIETMIRTRLLAKQAIIQGVIQDRMAQAVAMKQHAHKPELLMPGTAVDIWRKPDRKDEPGWRGPAELISLRRSAGSAIVEHQGKPLIIPLHQLRRHILFTFFNYIMLANASEVKALFCNPTLVLAASECFYYDAYGLEELNKDSANVMELMDLVDGTATGKLIWIGVVWKEDSYVYVPDKAAVNTHPLVKLAINIFKDYIQHPHGVIYGTDLRRLPGVQHARWSLLFRWRRTSRTDYNVRLHRAHRPLTFTGDQHLGMSSLIIYSYDHSEELENNIPEDMDWSDISSIPGFGPDDDDDDDMRRQPDDTIDDLLPTDPPGPPRPPSIPPAPMLDPGEHDVPPPRAHPGQPPAPGNAPGAAPTLVGPQPDFPMPPFDDGDDDNMQPTQPTTTDVPDVPMQPMAPLAPPTPDILQPPTRRPTTDTQVPPPALDTPTVPQGLQPLLPVTPDVDIDTSIDNELNRTRSPRRPTTTMDTVSPKRVSINPTPETIPVPPTSNKREHDDDMTTQPLTKTAKQPQSTSSSSRDHTTPPATPLPPELPLVDPSTDKPVEDDPDATRLYDDDDPDATREYDDDPLPELITDDCTNVTNVLFGEWIREEEQIATMFRDLAAEFPDILHARGVSQYYVTICDGQILKVDDDKDNLSEADMAKYGHLIYAADRKELEAFITQKVFAVEKRRSLEKGANCVDCLWIRKWIIVGKSIKSRLCARGCFDKQKYLIDKHSSTATRLSQRLVISQGLCDGILYNPTDDLNDIDTESLDISTAFLQGLDYQQLQEQARKLGYEYRHPRAVYIIPPENVWRHFRNMTSAPANFKVADNARYMFVLRCLKAMYGFADAPLMFQLALIFYLMDSTGAIRSVFDDNYLYWTITINGTRVLALIMTVHVDDLQITGCSSWRAWIKGQLESRFGPMKQQRMPYTHAGIELERISPHCVRLHQDTFCAKLTPGVLPNERRDAPDSLCDATEKTLFRSLTCSALWATQTRAEEMCTVVSLQKQLKEPTIADIIAINAVIKRLRKVDEKFGIYFRRLTPPYRIVSISDASAPNKNTNFATEGIIVGLMEDRLYKLACDKGDFLMPNLVSTIGGKLHVHTQSAQRAKRISHSTSQAESLAATKAIPISQLTALRLTELEILNRFPEQPPHIAMLRAQDENLCPLPVDHYIDCMDLWELCCGLKGTPQDKSQRLCILAIREERRSLRLRRLYHIRTKSMVADMLTKYLGADSKSLLELLSCGSWTIRDDVRVRQGFGISAEQTSDTRR